MSGGAVRAQMPVRPLSPDVQRHLERTVEQVAVLWPLIDFVERYEWAKRVTWLCGVYPEGRWVSIGLPLILAAVERRQS